MRRHNTHSRPGDGDVGPGVSPVDLEHDRCDGVALLVLAGADGQHVRGEVLADQQGVADHEAAVGGVRAEQRLEGVGVIDRGEERDRRDPVARVLGLLAVLLRHDVGHPGRGGGLEELLGEVEHRLRRAPRLRPARPDRGLLDADHVGLGVRCLSGQQRHALVEVGGRDLVPHELRGGGHVGEELQGHTRVRAQVEVAAHDPDGALGIVGGDHPTRRGRGRRLGRGGGRGGGRRGGQREAGQECGGGDDPHSMCPRECHASDGIRGGARVAP